MAAITEAPLLAHPDDSRRESDVYARRGAELSPIQSRSLGRGLRRPWQTGTEARDGTLRLPVSEMLASAFRATFPLAAQEILQVLHQLV
jgi:hypothetical protein